MPSAGKVSFILLSQSRPGIFSFAVISSGVPICAPIFLYSRSGMQNGTSLAQNYLFSNISPKKYQFCDRHPGKNML